LNATFKNNAIKRKFEKNTKKMAKDPIEKNRAQLVDLLMHKSALKQDIADDSEKVFERLKTIIISEITELKKSITDPRVRLSYQDKGKFEIHAYVGSDVLVFNLHQNVFRLPDHNPLWGTAYFKQNQNNGYFSTIHIFNFLAESLLQNRMNDAGYLIGRLFLNHENHFLIEGKGTLGFMFRDPQNMVLSDDALQLIVQLSFAHALEFDLYIPPFEYLSEISVAQIQMMGESLKLETAKRLGFKMKHEEDSENY
jgi:hypothetical protein